MLVEEFDTVKGKMDYTVERPNALLQWTGHRDFAK
jgi:hypothetical protein